MTDREDPLNESLENQVQDWFDASVPPLDVFCQHRLARRASEIPEKGAWRLSPLARHFIGAMGLAFAMAVVSVSLGESPLMHHSVRGFDRGEWLVEPNLEESIHWDAEFNGAGFNLLHGGSALDEDVLEASFRALLEEG